MVSVIQGDCLEEMRKMKPCSIDFIVCDPPYGLNFMGKKWDRAVPNVDIWKEALRVCKPGSMLAAFGGSRTHHHLMIALEQSGWEMRDVIMWLYGQGFPKSLNINKSIDKSKGLEREIIGLNPNHRVLKDTNTMRGQPHTNSGVVSIPYSELAQTFSVYGTALKPSYEPIIIAMKPCEGSFAHNAEKWGVAGINIDGSRIGNEQRTYSGGSKLMEERPWTENQRQGLREKPEYTVSGRWPANIILDQEAEQQLGEPSRFFYCAKASAKERNQGCDGGITCTHPTVKPIALMKYIINLLAPPGNPILLDPFAGSGSTLIAAQELGIESIGIELNLEYVEIARKRISHD